MRNIRNEYHWLLICCTHNGRKATYLATQGKWASVANISVVQHEVQHVACMYVCVWR